MLVYEFLYFYGCVDVVDDCGGEREVEFDELFGDVEWRIHEAYPAVIQSTLIHTYFTTLKYY